MDLPLAGRLAILIVIAGVAIAVYRAGPGMRRWGGFNRAQYFLLVLTAWPYVAVVWLLDDVPGWVHAVAWTFMLANFAVFLAKAFTDLRRDRQRLRDLERLHNLEAHYAEFQARHGGGPTDPIADGD